MTHLLSTTFVLLLVIATGSAVILAAHFVVARVLFKFLTTESPARHVLQHALHRVMRSVHSVSPAARRQASIDRYMQVISQRSVESLMAATAKMTFHTAASLRSADFQMRFADNLPPGMIVRYAKTAAMKQRTLTVAHRVQRASSGHTTTRVFEESSRLLEAAHG